MKLITDMLKSSSKFLLGLILAGFSLVFMILIVGPLVASLSGSLWTYGLVMGFLCPILWMIIALKTAGPSLNMAIGFFISGAGAAWILTMVFGTLDTPVYYGLPSFLAACVGGVIGGWIVLRELNLPHHKQKMWFGVVSIVVLIALLFPMFNAGAGFSRSAFFGDQGFELGLIEGRYVWIRNDVSNEFFDDSNHVGLNVEFDPGSGTRWISITKVTDPVEIEKVRIAESHMMKGVIAREMSPSLTWMGPLYSGFDRGQVWKIDTETVY